MKKSLFRTLAMALCIVMAFGLMVPAFAAITQTVAVSYDGVLQYKNGYAEGTKVSLPLYTTGERGVEKVTVSSGEYFKEVTAFDTATKDTLPNGTVYTLSATKDADESMVLTLSTTGIKDALTVEVTTEDAAYDVMANSGTYGQNSNYGNTGSATCEINKTTFQVAGGKGYAIEFKANAGLEVTHLNIRANYSNRSNVVSVDAGTVTVAGQTFVITKDQTAGTVTVACVAAKHDMFVTALTANAAKKYTLNVTTDAHLTSNVASVVLSAGTAKDVTFTPVSGYYVESVQITDGTAVATIQSATGSVRVNGHTYTLDRKPDGSAVLSVPGVAANVSVAAAAGTGRTYIEVKGKGFSSNFTGLTYVADNSSNTVVIRPNDGVVIEYISVDTANGSTRFAADDEYFVLAGILYRVAHETNGRILIYLNPMPGNTSITIHTKDTYHNVTLSADEGSAVVGSASFSVEDGKTKDVTFKPLSGYEIQRISVTVAGDTYTANVTKGYVAVNGVRYPISVSDTGRVTVTIPETIHDVAIKAISDYVKTPSLITKNQSDHATISVSPSVVCKNDSATITVKPASGYDVKSIVLTSEGRSVTIGKNAGSVTVNGVLFRVSYKSNGNVVLTSDKVTKTVSVAVNTTRNGEEIKDYHAPYMYGIGNGLFAPEANMSRAEAVTLLVRLFSGLEEDELLDYSTDSYFRDVAGNAWYTPYIVWAEDEGLLNNLNGSSRYFRPTDAVTRAEFVDFICRFKGGYETTGYNLGYTDMTWGHWASRQVAYATGMGWLKGYPNGAFGADDTITRCQVATVISRAMGREDTNFIYTVTNPVFFLDVPATHWAYGAITEATNGHYVH